jgi:phosphatidylglycerophosphatase A
MQKLIKQCATFFGVGFLPRMPGTWGSMCGAGIYLLTRYSWPAYWSAAILITAAGFLVSGKYEAAQRYKDPPEIVIDEVSGMLFTYALVSFSLANLAAGFCLFRFFDIVKPYPIRNIESLPGSAGIMLDDLLAALYSAVSLYAMNQVIMVIGYR